MGLLLDYSVDLSSCGAGWIGVDLAFECQDNRLTLFIPNLSYGDKRKNNFIRIKSVRVGETESVHSKQGSSLTLRGAAGKQITVRYQVKNSPGAEENTAACFHPVINSCHFHILGFNLFVRPANVPVCQIKVSWYKVPKHWRPGGPFASTIKMDSPGREDAYLETAFFGGDYRIYEPLPALPGVKVAIRGKWPVTDRFFIKRLQHLVTSFNCFWQNDIISQYTIVINALNLVPSEPGDNVLFFVARGISLRRGISVYLSVNAKSQLKHFNYLITHELSHEIFGNILQNAKPEAAYYWFSEGFADYFTHKMLLSSGLISVHTFIDILNERMAELYLSPHNQISNTVVQKEFWSDPEIRKLPYLRGIVFCFYLDFKIRVISGDAYGMKDVLTNWLKRGKTSQINNGKLNKQLYPYLKSNIIREIRKYISHGTLPVPDEFVLPPYLSIYPGTAGNKVPRIAIVANPDFAAFI